MALARIRNFSIIAHIDHGKSTLADRILEVTQTVSEREMRDQVLDSMELERERGITIRAQAVRVMLRAAEDRVYRMHLIEPPRALIFDSSYDQYRGVVAFVRMVDGSFHTRDKVRAMAQGTRFEVEELGFFSPGKRPAKHLSAGEVGYVITGLKDVSQLRVGDTLTLAKNGAAAPLPGYKDVKPMVFAGLFPTDSDQYPDLRDALE